MFCDIDIYFSFLFILLFVRRRKEWRRWMRKYVGKTAQPPLSQRKLKSTNESAGRSLRACYFFFSFFFFLETTSLLETTRSVSRRNLPRFFFANVALLIHEQTRRPVTDKNTVDSTTSSERFIRTAPTQVALPVQLIFPFNVRWIFTVRARLSF